MTDGSRTRTCSVVICAHTEDRWDDVLRSVGSVRAQEPAPQDVVVVVDHNPALQDRLSSALPAVRVVANAHQRGLSGARNTGVALTDSDVVVFLDDDAVARPGWLAGIIRHYADANVLGVGTRIEADWDGVRPRWWPPEFDWVVGCTYTGHPSGAVRNLIGASASFRRELFDDDGFTAGIGRSAVVSRPVGCEETDFCIRARHKRPGGVFLHTDEATVLHRVRADRQTFGYFRARCYAEGLSKAQLTARVGSGDGLASEWTYSTRTLPLGVLRGIGEATRGDPSGLLRAGAIITGLAYTTAGYVVGRWLRVRRGSTARPCR